MKGGKYHYAWRGGVDDIRLKFGDLLKNSGAERQGEGHVLVHRAWKAEMEERKKCMSLGVCSIYVVVRLRLRLPPGAYDLGSVEILGHSFVGGDDEDLKDK